MRHRDIAVLVRSRGAYAWLTKQFATFGIPVQPDGRSGLFDQPEGGALCQTVAWLADFDWRDGRNPGSPVTDAALLGSYQRVFDLTDARPNTVSRFLREGKTAVPPTGRAANLVGRTL